MRRSILFAILSATFAVTLTASAQPGDFPPALAARLDDALEQMRAASNATGVAAAIISPRHGTWIGTSGASSIATGDPVRPEMLFGIGSISKTHTSAVILDLVDEGRLSLDDTIGTWVGGYRNVNGRITVRQLLQHTGGLYNYTNSDEFWERVFTNPGTPLSGEDLLRFVGPSQFTPGFRWEYSNTGYVLLGMIIERITGRSFEEELAERFLEPAGLDEIPMGYSGSIEGPVVGSWFDLDGDGTLDDMGGMPRAALFSGAWTAGGLLSSAGNIARWGNLLYTGRLLSPAMMSELTTFRSLTSELGTGGGYGLGIIRVRLANRVAWGHTGGIPGFTSALWHFPADSVTVAVLINEVSDAPSAIANGLAVLYFQSASAPNDEKAASRIAAAAPNPFASSTTIAFTTSERASTSVTVHDLLGAPVRTLLEETLPIGGHAVTWDGSANGGERAPAGTYIVRIRTGERVTTTTVVRQ